MERRVYVKITISNLRNICTVAAVEIYLHLNVDYKLLCEITLQLLANKYDVICM